MTEKMTAQDATHFENGHSLTSAMVLTAAAEARGCSCIPYTDWFTYKRWKAQGFQVQKGEHGIKLTVYIPNKPDEDGESTGTHPWYSTVFCRHQVKPIQEVH